MDDVENLLHQAQLGSAPPALPTGVARRALRGVRRRRQLQAGAVGGMTVAVVGGGGAWLASTRPQESGGQPAGGAPAPAPVTTTAAPLPSDRALPSPRLVPSPSFSTAVATSVAPSSAGGPPTAVRTQAPATTPECLDVEAHLASVAAPSGYSRTDAIQPAQVMWQRGWLRADKAHASLEVTAFCIDPKAVPPAYTGETAAGVTVQGHAGLLTTDLGGSFARVTWKPNPSTEVSVSANAFEPNSWGRTPVDQLKAARLTDDQLVAFAQTVPTG